jgi:hypothetical protein
MGLRISQKAKCKGQNVNKIPLDGQIGHPGQWKNLIAICP